MQCQSKWNENVMEFRSSFYFRSWNKVAINCAEFSRYALIAYRTDYIGSISLSGCLKFHPNFAKHSDDVAKKRANFLSTKLMNALVVSARIHNVLIKENTGKWLKPDIVFTFSCFQVQRHFTMNLDFFWVDSKLD